MEVFAYSVPPGHVGNGLILRDRLERRQTVTLTNHGKTARNVRLYARLPLSTQPDASVEATFSPKPANLGDVRSTITHPWTTTHGKMQPEAKYAAGIREGLLRISVGLEHADDLIADLAQAMA